MALPIRGKKSRLTRNDLFGYYAAERLQLNPAVQTAVVQRFQAAFPRWGELIAASFLSTKSKEAYSALLSERRERLQL